MTVSSPPRHFIGEQEYLDGELHGELRHVYIDGQVFAMTGASDRHGLILNALAYSMTPAARRKGCQLFTSDMKLRLEIGGKTCFYYPDLLLSCDPPGGGRRGWCAAGARAGRSGQGSRTTCAA